MDTEKKNGFVEFVKKYGIFVIVALVIFAIALTFTLVAALGGTVPTSTTRLNFQMPMTDANVIKDYSIYDLQKNEMEGQWEAHLYVDLVSENKDVYSILDGEVTGVQDLYLDGYTVTIKHANGFQSIYSSLNRNVEVKVGDQVKAGEKIGEIDETALGELDLGAHLHFAMKLNDNFVDPNEYLEFQVK